MIRAEWMVPVDSSWISAVGFEFDEPMGKQMLGTLTLALTDGAVYEFYEVSAYVYVKLLQASSTGKAFWALLRDKYPYERVG